MRKKKTYLQKTPCSKYLGITHYRAYLFTGNLNTIILPKKRSNAVLEQFCNTEYNLQQIMQFDSRSYRRKFSWICQFSAAVWGQVLIALHIKWCVKNWMGYGKYSSFLKDFILMKTASLGIIVLEKLYKDSILLILRVHSGFSQWSDNWKGSSL